MLHYGVSISNPWKNEKRARAIRSLILVSLTYFLALLGHNFQHVVQSASDLGKESLVWNSALDQADAAAQAPEGDCYTCRLLDFSGLRLANAKNIAPVFTPLLSFSIAATNFGSSAISSHLATLNQARAPPRFS